MVIQIEVLGVLLVRDLEPFDHGKEARIGAELGVVLSRVHPVDEVLRLLLDAGSLEADDPVRADVGRTLGLVRHVDRQPVERRDRLVERRDLPDARVVGGDAAGLEECTGVVTRQPHRSRHHLVVVDVGEGLERLFGALAHDELAVLLVVVAVGPELVQHRAQTVNRSVHHHAVLRVGVLDDLGERGEVLVPRPDVGLVGRVRDSGLVEQRLVDVQPDRGQVRGQRQHLALRALDDQLVHDVVRLGDVAELHRSVLPQRVESRGACERRQIAGLGAVAEPRGQVVVGHVDDLDGHARLLEIAVGERLVRAVLIARDDELKGGGTIARAGRRASGEGCEGGDCSDGGRKSGVSQGDSCE